jgi:branched-chain amino acid aminotransferase
MTKPSVQRIAYFNGRFVPEREVLVPYRDRGFRSGDAAFDTTRTFGHRVFKLREHVDRLYRSLHYLQIDAGLSPTQMVDITEQVVRRNLPLLAPEDDYFITQRVTRGLDPAEQEFWEQDGPTIIVECRLLPLRARASLFRDGIRLITSSIRRVPPAALSPRAKTHNFLNTTLADLEAKKRDPKAWALLLDINGNLAEGSNNNIFLVKDGVVMTPREQFVLPGISRATVIQLASEIGIPLVERDLDLFDGYNADEIFLTASGLCLCPVQSLNGVSIGAGIIPGPVTRQLSEAYQRLVNFDFVAQHLKWLE